MNGGYFCDSLEDRDRGLDSRATCERFNAMVSQAILRGEPVTLEVT